MYHTVRPNLPPLPPSMRDLKVDQRGYPVPFFVQWINGVPEFRIMSRGAMNRAVLLKLCWICGKPLGNRIVSFVIGPMCAINRISAEPPSHPECADFAVHACPFMVMPKMRRREDGMPEKAKGPGVMIERNPGVMLIWHTRRWEVLQETEGYLFEVGRAIRVEWFTEGRKALRSEVLASIEGGLPTLRAYAETDEEKRDLEERRIAAMRLLPRELRV